MHFNFYPLTFLDLSRAHGVTVYHVLGFSDTVFLCVQNTHLINSQSCSRVCRHLPQWGGERAFLGDGVLMVYLRVASCKPPYHSIGLGQAKHHEAQIKEKKAQRLHVEPQIATSTIYNLSEMRSPRPRSKK